MACCTLIFSSLAGLTLALSWVWLAGGGVVHGVLIYLTVSVMTSASLLGLALYRSDDGAMTSSGP